MNTTEADYQRDCQTFTAATVLKAAEGMNHSQRVMIYRGIVALLPEGTEAHATARSACTALEQAERDQLHLFELLNDD